MPFASSYEIQAYEVQHWGQHYCGPHPGSKLPHGQEVLFARIEASSEDGRPVEVFCSAYPARFYTVRSGELVLRTGSDAAKLAFTVATAVAAGMLGVETIL